MKRGLVLGALAIGREVLRLILRRPVIGVVAVALDADERLVLLRRRDTGTWGLPGGMLEWGERLEDGLRREVREEIGRAVVAVRRVIGVYSDPLRDPRMHSVCVLVEIEVGPPLDGATQNPAEVIETRAFPPGAVPSALAFDTAHMIAEWRRGGPAVLD